MLPARTFINRIASVGSASMERFREASRPARIGFVIDATGSRSDTWEQAQAVQRRMFDATARLSRLHVRLVHFGGKELIDHGWAVAPRNLSAAMAGVRCAAGMTQIVPALRTLIEGAPEDRPQAVVLVGDCFEEEIADASSIATAYKAAGITIHALHEGDDRLARRVFEGLAGVTGGRFFRFGSELPLGELMEALAVLTAGGEKALLRLTNNRAVALLLAGPQRR